MTELQANELELVGSVILENGRTRNDAVAERIKWLIRNKLKKLSVTSGGWETLYVDPVDGRYWELSYPQSEVHGGGPQKLTILSPEKAKTKYLLSQ
jgi:hypothetical protein